MDWLIAAFVGAGGVGAVGYLVQKYVDSVFDSRLQAERRHQEESLADYKSEIDARLDRLRRFAQSEADATAAAWEAVNAYVDRVRANISRLKSYPDVDRLGADVFRALLDASGLSIPARLQIEQSADRGRAYREAVDHHQLTDAKRKAQEFRGAFIRSMIFLEQDVRDQLQRIDDLAWRALVEHEVRLDHGPSPELWQAHNAFSDQIDALLLELERSMRAQLTKAPRP